METREMRKAIFALAVPASLEAVFQMCLGFVDQVVIGRLGEAPLAAVGLTNNLMFLATLMLGAISSGTAILVAQHQGRRDGEGASRATGSSILAAALVTVPVAALAAAMPRQALRMLGAEEAVAISGQEFFRFVALTLPLSVCGSVMVGALRSLGDSRTPMFITIASVGVNTALNLVLVFGLGPVPALGVAGAAYSTLLAQVVRLAGLSWCLLHNGRAPIEARHWVRMDGKMLSILFHLVYPIVLTEALWAIGNFSYTLMSARLGTTAVVATQMVIATEGIFLMFSSGLSVAALTLVGQDLGAGSLEEMKLKAREIIRIGVATSVLFGLGLAVVSVLERRFYPNVSEEALRLAILGILLNAVFQPAKVLNMVMGNGVLRAGGDTRFLLAADAITVYAAGLPLAILFAFVLDMGLVGIFIGRLAEEVLRVSLFFIRYRTPHWHRSLAVLPTAKSAPS